ncbi:MAG: hypothetical protein ACHREM_02325 [Polyangiales bacterium]
MHHHYEDIISRIAERPTWHDEHGVPRWGTFAPNASANIYADEACLLEIACQSCRTKFRVCMSWSDAERLLHKIPSLSDRVRDGSIHYGDPPNMECCPAGPTMNSVRVRVIEFWTRTLKVGPEWTRKPKLEVAIDDDD